MSLHIILAPRPYHTRQESDPWSPMLMIGRPGAGVDGLSPPLALATDLK